MTHNRFITIKADFVCQYRQVLCEESIKDIDDANDWHSFVDILRKYMSFNTYRPFPDVEWVRKWFSDDTKSLHDEGIYLDEVISVNAEINKPIICYGKCIGMAIFKEPAKYYVMLQDDSKLNVVAYGQSVVFVKTKGEAKVFVMHRDKTSIVKKRHYEGKNGTKWC